MKAFIYDMDGVIADTEPVHMQCRLAISVPAWER